MATGVLSDEQIQDAGSIPEPEQTLPSPEVIKAKAEGFIPLIAGRKDGAEFCESVYLEDEGGYAVRRFNLDNSQPWRFMRTKDYDEAFIEFMVIDAKVLESRLAAVVR